MGNFFVKIIDQHDSLFGSIGLCTDSEFQTCSILKHVLLVETTTEMGWYPGEYASLNIKYLQVITAEQVDPSYWVYINPPLPTINISGSSVITVRTGNNPNNYALAV